MSKIVIIGAGQAGGRLVQNLLANQNDDEIYLHEKFNGNN